MGNASRACAGTLSLLFFFGVGTATAAGEKSLARCQGTAGKAIAKYVSARQKVLSGCFTKVAGALVGKSAPDAADAAKSCASRLRKLVNTDDPSKELAAKTRVKILDACDPSVNPDLAHTTDDVLGEGATVGGQSTRAGLLGSQCKSFEGSGKIDSVKSWVDCQLEAADCRTDQGLAISYPPVLAWAEDLHARLGELGSDQRFVDAAQAVHDVGLALDRDADGEVDIVCGMFTEAVIAADSPVCDADGNEENGTEATATALGAGTTGAYMCNGDDDYYEVAPTLAGFVATITFTHSVGDLDMSLYGAGSILATSQSVTDQEQLAHDASAAPLFLRVYGYNGGTGPYDIELVINTPRVVANGPLD